MIDKVRYYSRNLVREFGFLKTQYEDSGATYSETHALLELGRLGSLEVGELGKILHVDKSVSSRILSSLQKKSWVLVKKTTDLRKKAYGLSSRGRKVLDTVEQQANARVERAFAEMDESERKIVLQGLALYSKALKLSRLREEYTVRIIQKEDDVQIARIVKRTLKEMGFKGPGTAAADETLDRLSETFVGEGKVYFVAEKDGKICGGAGIAPLVGGTKETCELVRMFIAHESRGSGLGHLLMSEALQFAKGCRYDYCYLETTERMQAAQKLYLNSGFEYLSRRKGRTGHFACKVFMGKKL